LSVSFQQCSVLNHSVTDTVQPEQLTSLSNNTLRKGIPVCILTTWFFKIHFNIILLSLPIANCQGLFPKDLLIKTPNGKNVPNYNFTHCFVCVWNLVSPITRRTQTEGVQEKGAEGNIWDEEAGGDRRIQKTAE
jgi:hypothetical protein